MGNKFKLLLWSGIKKILRIEHSLKGENSEKLNQKWISHKIKEKQKAS